MTLFTMNAVAGGNVYTDYTETFETDTHGADPAGGDWYTYGETDGFDWANVDNTYPRNGANSFLINDTVGATTDKVFLNFTDNTVSMFSFWFKWNNGSHNQTYGMLSSTAGGFVDIDFGNDIGKLKVYTYDTTYIETFLENQTWYRLRFDMNYTNDKVRIRLYSNASAVLNDTWATPNNEVSGDLNIADLTSFTLYGATDDWANLYFDDLAFQTYYVSGHLRDTDGLSASEILLIVFLGIAVMLVIAMMAIELINNPKPDIKRLFYMLIAVVIMVIAMGFI